MHTSNQNLNKTASNWRRIRNMFSKLVGKANVTGASEISRSASLWLQRLKSKGSVARHSGSPRGLKPHRRVWWVLLLLMAAHVIRRGIAAGEMVKQTEAGGAVGLIFRSGQCRRVMRCSDHRRGIPAIGGARDRHHPGP